MHILFTIKPFSPRALTAGSLMLHVLMHLHLVFLFTLLFLLCGLSHLVGSSSFHPCLAMLILLLSALPLHFLLFPSLLCCSLSVLAFPFSLACPFSPAAQAPIMAQNKTIVCHNGGFCLSTQKNILLISDTKSSALKH